MESELLIGTIWTDMNSTIDLRYQLSGKVKSYFLLSAILFCKFLTFNPKKAPKRPIANIA